VNALQSVTSTLPPPGPTWDRHTLTTIAAACRCLERLRVANRRHVCSETLHKAEPHSLVALRRRWYLVAFDCEREGWRTFRVDRLERPSPAGSRFVPRPLPGGDPAAYVAQNLSSAPYRFHARVTLRAPAAEVRARTPFLWGQVDPVDEHTCEYRTSDDSLDWLALRIGMIGVEFEVHEPPELAERLRSLGARLGRAAGTSP
jgi:predicted DNA-binding transcriptional regulator YafY